MVDDLDVTVFSRRDAPDAVVMSLETCDSWRDTAHLLGTPAKAAHLARSLKQLQSGKVRERCLIDA